MTQPAARVLTTLLVLAPFVPLTAGAQTVVGRSEGTFTLQEPVGSGQWVRIASPNGVIRVTEGGDRLDVQAVKEVRRGQNEDVGFVVRRGPDGITLCAVFDSADECRDDGSLRTGNRSRQWWSARSIRVNFTVRVPAGMKIRAASGNGDVSVAGGGAVVHASSGNGRIDVSGTTGEVTASSGNGRVTVQGARGPVEISTGNGDVMVSTSLGPVTASSGNGDIDVTMDRISGAPDMSFSTGNGRITVAVPEGFGAQLDSNTGHGDVTVALPLTTQGTMKRSRVRGTIGNGGGRLTMHSGNGDLAVVRRP
jgi:Putative adhesin